MEAKVLGFVLTGEHETRIGEGEKYYAEKSDLKQTTNHVKILYSRIQNAREYVMIYPPKIIHIYSVAF